MLFKHASKNEERDRFCFDMTKEENNKPKHDMFL